MRKPGGMRAIEQKIPSFFENYSAIDFFGSLPLPVEAPCEPKRSHSSVFYCSVVRAP